MLTRRKVLGGLLAGSIWSRGVSSATPVNFAVPSNACDCHTHVIGDPGKFPFWAGRSYTPETALPEEMSRLHHSLHVKRVVIVTPSVYGTDNSATLYGMKARGADARGVAVIDAGTPDAKLDALNSAGIRGIRINLATAGQTDPAVARERFRALAERASSHGWHIQMYTSVEIVAAIKDVVLNSPVPVVFDHFGGVKAALGLGQPGFADLVEMVRLGKAYVKLSGAYRASALAPDYPDVRPFAKELIAANPDRILWGTDWPHPDTTPHPGHKATDVTPPLKIEDGRLLNQLAVWAGDPAVRKKILVSNPAQLYGF